MTTFASSLFTLPSPVNTTNFTVQNIPVVNTLVQPIVQSGEQITLLVTYDNTLLDTATWQLSWLKGGTNTWDDSTSFVLGYIGLPQGVYLLVKH